jgi:hypothetical protein
MVNLKAGFEIEGAWRTNLLEENQAALARMGTISACSSGPSKSLPAPDTGRVNVLIFTIHQTP